MLSTTRARVMARGLPAHSRNRPAGTGPPPGRAGLGTVGQTAVYVGASALASAASGISKGLLAALLSTAGFGAFAVAQTILEYMSMLCEFGLFLPAARASAVSDAEEQREIVGAAVVMYVPVAAIFVLGVLAVSAFVDGALHVHAGGALRVTAIMAIGWPFVFVGLQLSQGVGKLQISAWTSLLSRVLLLTLLLVATLTGSRLSVTGALIMQDIGLLVGGALLVVWLRPRFRRLGARMLGLARAARAYGFQVYVGRVLAVGTYNMDVLMLAALTNTRTVAHYALAGAIATAVGLPVTGFANALFSRMARSDRLDGSWLAFAWGLGLAAVPVTWALTHVAVGTIFASSYAPTVMLVVPLGLAQVVRGVTGVYIQFLSAHARGRELRNAALVLTVGNIVLNLALIPSFGAEGAAWASVLALLANWLAHAVAYRKVSAQLRQAPRLAQG